MNPFVTNTKPSLQYFLPAGGLSTFLNCRTGLSLRAGRKKIKLDSSHISLRVKIKGYKIIVKINSPRQWIWQCLVYVHKL
jgi:hypothetical protein